MSNVDVEIYFSQFKEFFKENPSELKNLIGSGKPEDFFNEVYATVSRNYESGEELELTKKQIIEIVLKINQMGPHEKIPPQIFQNTKFGKIYLN